MVALEVPSHSSHIIRSFSIFSFSEILQPPPRTTLFPYTTLFRSRRRRPRRPQPRRSRRARRRPPRSRRPQADADFVRSEEHTSELQSPDHLVCRLLLEKKNIKYIRQVLYSLQ